MQIYPDMTSENSVMVGDRKYDVEGAHALGIPAVAVLYGYGDEAELSAAGADHTVSDVKNLKKLLLVTYSLLHLILKLIHTYS
jgi:phosphoglycolate phosphatase